MPQVLCDDSPPDILHRSLDRDRRHGPIAFACEEHGDAFPQWQLPRSLAGPRVENLTVMQNETDQPGAGFATVEDSV